MKHQKGQALPLAMMALAIGVLLIVPFLSHAGTSLISSRVYSGSVTSRSASDAGVEHAIWGLTRGTLASQIPNPGDSTTYNLAEQLNGIPTTVTVTTDVSGSSGVIGSLTSVLSSFIYDAYNGYTPDIVMVSNSVCATAYRGASNKGYITTESISAAGIIGSTVIDSLNFQNANCYEPDIIQVATGIYAIAFRGASNRGNISTISIDASGNIGNAFISTYVFDSTACYEPDVIRIANNIFAIAYRGSSNRGYLKTITISNTGVITASVISTLIFDTTACYTPRVIPVSGTYYVIAYTGTTNRGYLKTVTISAAGVIGGATVSTLIFDTTACYAPDITPVSGTYYAIVYRGPTNRGYVKTVTIAANGIIGGSAISTLVFDSATAYEPYIVNVINDVFAIAYRSGTNVGYLKTISISGTGIISPTVIDTLIYAASSCFEPRMVYEQVGILAIAFRGTGNDGTLVTVGVTTSGSTAASYEIVSAAGNTTIKALVNTANTTASIVSWLVE
jgi:hypothetical protein